MPRAFVLVLLLAACGDDSSSEPTDAASADASIDRCSCAYKPPIAVGTIGSPAVELSGLGASRTHPALWTHNDSDSTPRVIAISTTNGAVLGELALPGATITDQEDLAVGPCAAGNPAQCIFLADIGDNNLVRTTVRIYEIDEPASTANGTGTFRTFDLAYPDGAHNAEALFVDSRDAATYVIAKQAAVPTPVFKMPRTAGQTATAELVGTFRVPTGNALVTGADFLADACGTRLLVRTYTNVFELRAGATATIAELLATTPRSVPAPSEQQGEAIAWATDGASYYTTTEGTNVALSHVVCP